MKIPTSSSILLATLAISSSSTFAAPTGHGAADGGIASSQSNNHLPSEGTDADLSARSMEGGELEARQNGMVSDILAGLPIVGPLAKALLIKDCPNPNGASTESVDAVSPDEVARLQSAVDTVSDALKGVLPLPIPISVPVPLPTDVVGGIVSMIPAPDPVKSAIAGVADTDPNQPPDAAATDPPAPAPTGEPGPGGDTSDSDASGSFLISPTTTIANAEEAGETSEPTNTDTGSIIQATPSGPPNTPAMPESTGDADAPPAAARR